MQNLLLFWQANRKSSELAGRESEMRRLLERTAESVSRMLVLHLAAEAGMT
jgi:hypothetical protein